jgi:hypothetical protein
MGLVRQPFQADSRGRQLSGLIAAAVRLESLTYIYRLLSRLIAAAGSFPG